MKTTSIFLAASLGLAAPTLAGDSNMRFLLGNYEVVTCLADGNTVSVPFKIHVDITKKNDKLDTAINAYINAKIKPAAAASSGRHTYVDVMEGRYNPYSPVLPFLELLGREILGTTGADITPQFTMPGKLGMSKYCNPYLS